MYILLLALASDGDFGFTEGKLRCRSGCASLEALLQAGHTPQESAPDLFSQNIYCASATAIGKLPVPSAPAIMMACGNLLCCHMRNNPCFAACWPMTSRKSMCKNKAWGEKRSYLLKIGIIGPPCGVETNAEIVPGIVLVAS